MQTWSNRAPLKHVPITISHHDFSPRYTIENPFLAPQHWRAESRSWRRNEKSHHDPDCTSEALEHGKDPLKAKWGQAILTSLRSTPLEPNTIRGTRMQRTLPRATSNVLKHIQNTTLPQTMRTQGPPQVIQEMQYKAPLASGSLDLTARTIDQHEVGLE